MPTGKPLKLTAIDLGAGVAAGVGSGLDVSGVGDSGVGDAGDCEGVDEGSADASEAFDAVGVPQEHATSIVMNNTAVGITRR